VPNDNAELETPDDAVHVYTDGACSGNPGPGGWAWAADDGREGAGGTADTTNQRMELTAVLEALRAIDGPVVVHSDSTYVVNCYNDRWYEGWLARNWRNTQRKPVANRDLWEPLVAIFQRRRDELFFVWVKGHSGVPMNDYVDQLAVAQIDDHRPAADGGVGVESEPSRPMAPWPIDRAVAVTGSKDVTPDITDGLSSALDGLDPGFDILISGLRRGPELGAAELGIARGIPLGVVLPFADPTQRWPGRDRRRFDACINSAEWVVTLEGDRAKPGAAVADRDRWLWGQVVGAIVVDDAPLAARLDELGLGVVIVDAAD
jgi:ribonuclease HI